MREERKGRTVRFKMGKEGKTPKKDKKDKTPSKSKGGDDDEEGGELRPVCAIAKPLADIGFHKKILKVVKKGELCFVSTALDDENPVFMLLLPANPPPPASPLLCKKCLFATTDPKTDTLHSPPRTRAQPPSTSR